MLYMKKTVFLLLLICPILPVWSQTNIKFNGATFGTTPEIFISGFPEKPTIMAFTNREIFTPDVCNGYVGDIKLNTEIWNCYFLSSRKSNKVFRTVCNRHSDQMQNDLMLLVKTLEDKYGGHREEKQEDLGKIYSAYYLSIGQREMLALYYTIRNSNNQAIGEIRISCAPSDKEAKKGYIELSYTDFSTQKIAQNEYNSIMYNAL